MRVLNTHLRPLKQKLAMGLATWFNKPSRCYRCPLTTALYNNALVAAKSLLWQNLTEEIDIFKTYFVRTYMILIKLIIWINIA